MPHGFRVTFGAAIRKTLHGVGPLGPGPGTYELKGSIGEIASSSAKGGFAFPQQSSRDGLHPESTPPPVAYTVAGSKKQTKSDQPWDLVLRGKLSTPLKKTPGPGDYEFLDSVGGSAVHENLPKYTLHDRTKYSGRSRVGSATSPGFPHVFRHTVSSPGFIPAATAFNNHWK